MRDKGRGYAGRNQSAHGLREGHFRRDPETTVRSAKVAFGQFAPGRVCFINDQWMADHFGLRGQAPKLRERVVERCLFGGSR